MKKIASGLNILLATFVLLALAGWWMSVVTIKQFQDSERQVMLVARQRTLLQKMMKQAVMIQAFDQPQELQTDLSQTVADFDKVLEGFLEGSDENGIYRITDVRVANQLLQVDSVWKNCYDQLATVAEADPQSDEFSGALNDLVVDANELEGQLDTLFRLAQLQQEEALNEKLWSEAVLMIAALGTSFLVAWLYIRQKLTRPLGRLQRFVSDSYHVPMSADVVRTGSEIIYRLKEEQRLSRAEKETALYPKPEDKTQQPND
jgi:hypothetical protein